MISPAMRMAYKLSRSFRHREYHYVGVSHHMSFMEPLPDACPPAESEEVLTERVVYRLVRGNPPGLSDFRSQRAERPNAVFKEVSECLACGVSVQADRSECERLSKLPNLRGRMICCVRMVGGAGRIMQTFNNPSHHTWWPYATYDILSHCEVES